MQRVKHWKWGLLGVLFVLVWAIAFIQIQQAWTLLWFLVPVMGAGAVWAFLNFEGFLWLLVGLVPLSVNLSDLGQGIGMSLPSEPMMVLALMLLVLGMILGGRPPKGLALHPVSILIGLQLVWLVISGLWGVSWVTSAKLLVARGLYLAVFYLGFSRIFQRPHKIKAILSTYMVGILPVLAYAMSNLISYGISRKSSPEMADPFFDDHTLLGVCLAMLLPLAWLSWLHRESLLVGIKQGLIEPFLSIVLTTCLFFTFSRAAWMSVVAGAVFYLAMRMKISISMMAIVLLMGGGVAWYNQDDLVTRFSDNQYASGEDVLATAKSITNVSTDDSNKERLNRWASALRMTEERPWIGFGPGTYEQSYGRFQASHQMTRISTQDGDKGDAHSEYLNTLAEQGIPGLIIQLLLWGYLLYTGMKVAYRSTSPPLAWLAMALTTGLFTYMFHGLVNSFLDIDWRQSIENENQKLTEFNPQL